MEIWKDIQGYEGIYQISSFGNVKSLERIIKHPNCDYHQKERILKQTLDGGGYPLVGLHKDGVVKKIHVHRLVALAFVERKDLSLEVNHIDENKQNNSADNLEWVTRLENEFHGTKRQRQRANTDYSIIAKKNSKKILQLDLNQNVIREWNSLKDIHEHLGYSCGNISLCCNGKYTKPLYGYYWRFA